MVNTHFDLVLGPFWAPGGPKRAIWAQSLNFHVPIFWGILFVSNIGLWGVQTVAAECLAHPALLYPIWNPPARLGTESPSFGPWRPSEGPWWTDLVPTAPDWPAWVDFMVKTHFDLVSGPFWA